VAAPSRIARIGMWFRVQGHLANSRSFRGRIIVNCLAYVGAAGTVVQGADWISNLSPTVHTGLVAVLAVGLVIVFLRSAPRQSVTFVHDHSHARITIATGDLLGTYKHPAVITANRHLDTREEWVADSSLMGQLAARWYGSGATGREKLAKAIAAATGEPPEVEHEPGFVARVEHDDQVMLVLAVSSRDPDTLSSVLIDDIWAALSKLWVDARRYHYSALSLPIFGSGLAKAKVGPVPLLVLLLTSYVTAAMEKPLCAIRIVLPTTDLNPAVFEITKTYCQSMGFREV
jgi:hypothetical protein